jgi:hypothetical protein
VHLLFDGVVALDDANTVELWGTDRLTVSPDGLAYTVHLRPGVRRRHMVQTLRLRLVAG